MPYGAGAHNRCLNDRDLWGDVMVTLSLGVVYLSGKTQARRQGGGFVGCVRTPQISKM